MKKRIKHTLNFILKEVILKYLFCYILSVIALVVPLFLNIDEPWNSWLISFSASIFSLPVIFIIYNLYVSALEKHTQDKISQKINNNVINVFARFIYFTEYFYYKLEDEKNGDEDSLNKLLTYSEKELFKLISDNTFSGIILFVNAPKQGVVISSPMCVKLSENKFSGGTHERRKNNHMGRADPCLPE